MQSLGIADSVSTPDRASEAYTIRVFRKTAKGVSFVITVINLIMTNGIRQPAIVIITGVGGSIGSVNLIELQCRIMRRPLTLIAGIILGTKVMVARTRPPGPISLATDNQNAAPRTRHHKMESLLVPKTTCFILEDARVTITPDHHREEHVGTLRIKTKYLRD